MSQISDYRISETAHTHQHFPTRLGSLFDLYVYIGIDLSIDLYVYTEIDLSTYPFLYIYGEIDLFFFLYVYIGTLYRVA